jgi:hypothetical protein
MVGAVGEQLLELRSDDEEPERGGARRIRLLLSSSVQILVHDYSLRQFQNLGNTT